MIVGERPRPLKVLHVYRTYFPDTQGGGEEVIRQICLNTRSAGIESRVFTLSPHPASQPLAREEAQVIQAQRHFEIASCDVSLTAFGAFRRQAAWADILHYHYPWPFGDVLHLMGGTATAKPTVITFLSDVVRQKWLGKAYRPLMTRFLNQVDRIVATSPNHAASSTLLNRCQQKVSVIPIGLDEVDQPAASASAVAAYRQAYGDNFLLFVGVFRYYKGLHFLLEAARTTKANIVIAGAGPEEASLKAYAQEHNLTHVHFPGRVSDSDKVALLKACRAMVFPSHLPSESFGISLLEAAMQGKPMISCEIGTGTTYVNQQDETGLVVAPANPGQLSEAMNTLASDATLAEHMGKAARRRYQQLFTGAAMGGQYAALYRELARD